MPARINKFLIAALGALTLLVLGLDDGSLTAEEWTTVGAGVVAAFGVWVVPNDPTDRRP